MASTSKFASNLRFFCFILPILYVAFSPFISSTWLHSLTEAETNGNGIIFGEVKYEKISKKTDEQFSRWFIETGYYEKSITQKGRNDLKAGELSNDFVTEYFKNFWKTIYRALYRFNFGLIWMSGGVILLMAAIYDGWQMRNIKKHSMSLSNPLSVHFALHTFFLILGGAICLLFFPLTINPITWLVGILVLAFVSWKLTESFQIR